MFENDTHPRRLEYHPKTGAFHIEYMQTTFVMNDGWMVIGYNESYELCDDFIRMIRKRYPRISDNGCRPTADVIQAEFMDFIKTYSQSNG